MPVYYVPLLTRAALQWSHVYLQVRIRLRANGCWPPTLAHLHHQPSNRRRPEPPYHSSSRALPDVTV